MPEAKVKICGITRRRDALLAAQLGADFLGLNFYPRSPRYVDPRRARQIGEAVAGQVRLVGVFVNPTRAEVEEVSAAVALDLLQFHGDEPPALVTSFATPAIKALRVDPGFDRKLLAPYTRVWGLLFDRGHPTLYGGTGRAWDYRMVGRLALERPFFIAGGLRPDNLRQAITASGAWGVDVCSGVEQAPGIKDPGLLRRLFDEVHREG